MKTVDGPTLCETGRQPYANNVFSAGRVENDPCEHVYLKIEQGDEEPLIHYFERHEALAILWVLSGAIWSSEMCRAEDAGELDIEEK